MASPFQSFAASVRVAASTILVCLVVYALGIRGAALLLDPWRAEGSLLSREDGTIVGSRLLSQPFADPKYFWPRPSACGHNAAAAGASNKSPTSADLTQRGREVAALHGATPERPLPADLAAASGGGLDPHVTEGAARYQIDRVAAARPGIGRDRIEALVEAHAVRPGGALTPGRIVNVLELNLALDRLDAR